MNPTLARRDRIDALMVERDTPCRRPAVAAETPLSERLA